ncbi:hypothetical protein SMF913_10224 [Streptomyces malaysiensis]|uniref:Uncharacterized protein n=1 Tax=Streptomyces malaysiensis TaxID=92644 RepID=A0A2J7Z209_STRMQ|nr:hypothetical protein SMF913_10224 [Streptomyces malaysiensis]
MEQPFAYKSMTHLQCVICTLHMADSD